jgi:N-acyl amino acid synthase of PEP-CTERM/exosortase system
MLLIDRLFGKRDILIPYFDFSTVLRGTLESFILQDMYRLRYEVYCLECGYLKPRSDPARQADDGLETDAYDACSIHFAAYTLERTIVGTVRLVQPRAGQPYPFEEHCTVFDGFAPPARAQAGEISRLVVRKTHRRRRGDSLEGISSDFAQHGTTAGIVPPAGRAEKRNNSPLLLLGMYREMYRHSRANGVRYWYAAMERSLARSLEKMGFKFVPIGPQVDYYGPVTPHMVDLNDLDQRLRSENAFLAAWFNDEPIPLWIMLKTLVGSRLQRFRRAAFRR